MKRSEMVRQITEILYGSHVQVQEKLDDMAESILFRIEEVGMLPPITPVSCEFNGKMISQDQNIWEPEDG